MRCWKKSPHRKKCTPQNSQRSESVFCVKTEACISKRRSWSILVSALLTVMLCLNKGKPARALNAVCGSVWCRKKTFGEFRTNGTWDWSITVELTFVWYSKFLGFECADTLLLWRVSYVATTTLLPLNKPLTTTQKRSGFDSAHSKRRIFKSMFVGSR